MNTAGHSDAGRSNRPRPTRMLAAIVALTLVLNSWALLSDSRNNQSSAAPPPPEMNVVFVMVDDLKRVTGFLSDEPGSFLTEIYPDPAVRAQVRERLTPNLNQFADDSVVFTRAYSVSPVCNPSRTAMLTGLLPQQSGVVTNKTHFRGLAGGRDAVTLPQNFMNQGYYTAGVGKIFHKSQRSDRDWPDSNNSWTTWVNRTIGSPAGKTYSPYSTKDALFGTVETGIESFPDYQNASIIADALTGGSTAGVTIPEDDPFFLAYGGYLPHNPFISPESILAEFPADEIAITEASLQAIEEDMADLSIPAVAWTAKNGPFERILQKGRQIGGGTQGEVSAYRELVRHYLAAVATADRSLGQVLDAVEAGGHSDDTIVVVTGDHGFDLGEKSHVGKSNPWEESAGTPLMMKVPGAQPKRVDTPVSLMDIYPTLTSLAGLDLPESVNGNDLTPLLFGDGAGWDEPVLTIVSDGRKHQALRRERFTLLSWNSGQHIELYDFESDPNELTNIAYDPAYADVVAAMQADLASVLRGEDTGGGPGTTQPPTTTTTTRPTTTTTRPTTTTTRPTTTTTRPTTTRPTTTTTRPTTTTTLPRNPLEGLVVSAEPVTVTESDGNKRFSIQVSLDRPVDQPVEIYYSTPNGTASRNSDFRFSAGPLVFEPGQTQLTVGLVLRGDDLREPTESYSFRIRSTPDGVIASPPATITIRDDD